MINTKLTKKAMLLSYNAHKGQYDKGGVPYIYHPIHIAKQMNNELECIVALLHDVIEDANITVKYLEKEFPKEVIDILKLLTHNKEEDYFKYIKRVKSNEIARSVKIKDLIHNMDKSRLNNITKKDLERINKYKKALIILQNKSIDK